MNAGEAKVLDVAMKRRIRNGVLGLASLALAFYFGFIALLVYRRY
jgi:hypothetical protein